MLIRWLKRKGIKFLFSGIWYTRELDRLSYLNQFIKTENHFNAS